MKIYWSILSVLLAMGIANAQPTTVITTEPGTVTTTPTITTTPHPGTTTTTTTVVTRPAITTPVPAPRETVVVPSGYVSCRVVPAGWYDAIWVAEHRVCTYSGSAYGVVWVDGYWMCKSYSMNESQCTNWEWNAAHWEKTMTDY